jgi:small GTP-binding protein
MNNIQKLNYKIILVGDTGVGKTQVMLRYLGDDFDQHQMTTIGVDLKSSMIKLPHEGEIVKLNIWDTAGQERYRCLTKAYFRDSDGVFIIYSITNRESFANVRIWLKEVYKSFTDEKPVIFLIGNKNDLENNRRVYIDDVNKLVDEHKINCYIEVSAKSKQNITEMFTQMAEMIYNKKKPIKDQDQTGGQHINIKASSKVTGSSNNCC